MEIIAGMSMNSIVLIFHEITNPGWFENVIRLLKNRYNLVNVDNIKDAIINQDDPGNLCHITFDDGHVSFYNNVIPIIQKYKVPVSLFVSSFQENAFAGLQRFFQNYPCSDSLSIRSY